MEITSSAVLFIIALIFRYFVPFVCFITKIYQFICYTPGHLSLFFLALYVNHHCVQLFVRYCIIILLYFTPTRL